MPLLLSPLPPMPEIPVDFRAPPPSPVASGRRSSSFTNEDVLTEFLESSPRVPDLVLPDKIFPKQRHLETPPKVDFVSLCFHHDDALRDVVSHSMATVGCFQLLNHGIPPQLIASANQSAAEIFRVPPGNRVPVTRSPEKPWGFEEYHAGEEVEADEEGNEFSEEFVWRDDDEFKLKMEGILPRKYQIFSEKMETLKTRMETVAEKILAVMLKNVVVTGKLEGDGDVVRCGHEVGSVCCVSKHCRDDRSGRWGSSLKNDVIRMLIRGTDYCHSLCVHVCDGCSEFHVYSKKSWLSFFPEEGALIITGGDQTQILSGGSYKHVIGRPIFQGEKEDNISMAFLYSPQNTENSFETCEGRTISLGQQVILAIILTLVYHVMIYVYKFF